jgi:hypothetical protein
MKTMLRNNLAFAFCLVLVGSVLSGAASSEEAKSMVPINIQTTDLKWTNPAFRLGPDSYLTQPCGNYRHITSCDAASECVFFVESGGPFDLHVVKTTP